MSGENVLSVRKLCKSYKNGWTCIEALKGVSFDIKRGEFLIIMGTSGSGKSTLLKIIGALDNPTEGKVEINGEVIEDLSQEPFATRYRSENIGFVFQDYNLLKDLSVEENIAIPLILDGIDEDEITQRVDEQLELVGLGSWRKERPLKLSGGQKQRAAIARALIKRPNILLADEPTGNLDYNTSQEILKTIVDAKVKMKQTIILVTHDPQVASFGDRVLFFHDGEIVDEYINDKINEENTVDIVLSKFRQLIGRKK